MTEAVERIGGYCVRVVDVVRSASVNIQRRKGGALPAYNLPAYDHYRVLNSIMNKYVEGKKSVFFSMLEGSASDEHGKAPDIFGDQTLCILFVPYGKKETKGFVGIAVHPNDLYQFNHFIRVSRS